jgi:tRNA(Ile)-lysidine synthase TilS/MesJ
MVNEGDKIGVCMSGGKDSFLMAKCFQELKRHSDVNFDVEFIVMDPGYSEKNREMIINNAKLLNIPITIFETDIFGRVVNIEDSPCYLCARMRRGYLYNKAQELGCNKIALGHHFDDVIETVLMGMFYGAQFQTMMPKLHSTNHPGMELIRPMYFIREKDIKAWAKHHNLEFIQCACKFTEANANEELTSQRAATKKLIQELKKDIPQVEQNIFKAAENVTLDMILGYKDKGIQHSFLDDYENKK